MVEYKANGRGGKVGCRKKDGECKIIKGIILR